MSGSDEGMRGVGEIWPGLVDAMSQKMNALHSSLAFWKELSPSCSASNALILMTDEKMISSMGFPSMGMMAVAMKGGTGMKLRLGVEVDLAFVGRLRREAGSVASMMLLQDGLRDGSWDANRSFAAIWAG